MNLGSRALRGRMWQELRKEKSLKVSFQLSEEKLLNWVLVMRLEW